MAKTPTDLSSRIITGAIALGVLFLMVSYVVLPYFNTSYNITVTGLSSSLTQGILLIVFIIAMVGFALMFLKKY